jgi:predicted DNA-binding protein YlxM (UPF0122 family)
MKKKSFTITEAAKKLGISRQAIHDAIRKGQLKAKRGQIFQTVWLVSADAIQSYEVSVRHRTAGKKITDA